MWEIGKGHAAMYDWPLNDAHLLLLVLICVALIIIVATLTRVRRAEFGRLQNEVKQLSEIVKALEVAEQRRFIVELKSNGAGAKPEIAASATRVVAISESGPSDEEPAKPKPSLRFEQTVESGSDEGKARRKKRQSRDKTVTPAQDTGNVPGPTTT